jgi:DNA (cytosine-5)-methyltransferase 1
MTQEITMGSLFSGSGGFELAGSIFGIRPIWASEIEPFPILVTTKNFPEMKHLGDINKLNGADLEPVTIIAGGSPCQDMSIAGKREGLDGSRSNLFREQIRIVKEMRESEMWGNGIALPCAMFVMEGIAMILNEEDADEQK